MKYCISIFLLSSGDDKKLPVPPKPWFWTDEVLKNSKVPQLGLICQRENVNCYK